MTDLDSLRADYQRFQGMGLKLNMERGQPADANFDLSLPMLSAVDERHVITDSGVDIRNYPGGVAGLMEAREMFCEQIGVRPNEIIIGNNSSLDLMSSFLSWAQLKGVQGSKEPWVNQSPKLIVTTPGYDRHFSLASAWGYELVSVAMTSTGPDMDAVEALVENDSSIKGIFFVPRYSNPTGDTIDHACARRLVSMPTAAADFTIFADDAYAVHHLVDKPETMPNLLELAREADNEDRVILFGSTSKVTFASAGIAFAGMGEANMAHWSKLLSLQSIGPNKAEQWRHVRFLREYPDGLSGLMRDHAKILKPKFDAVQTVLNDTLGNLGLATWTQPQGGYFISVDTARPVASRVVTLAAEAGVALTPSGATFPGGVDPDNQNIRLAPTRPPVDEVEQAMQVFACCIKLASAEYDAQ
jgi:DNA-binding transcriptional MocR family regulator